MLKQGDTVEWNGGKAEVLRVFKNGRVRIAFWVQSLGMTEPKLWKETVSAKCLGSA